ncbi:nucleolar GTP-binding protein 2 [Cercophora newfieldiana]|uniref:Nucleolar GTP-binding protein 2 n=1 Tax=Cercophora newfieldiana TaxID=92897 RepID=A0AA40CZK8_9PEZI|nr:nucleolar GTP-binding protein 2 [Cercophora newfieldiana]
MAGSITKPKKPKSKRTPVRLRHKIQKASAAKQRKDKKLAKKNPEWRTKLKKDPGIPNLFPYKEKLLQQIEEDRVRRKEDLQRKRELAKAARSEVQDAGTTGQERMEDDDLDAEFRQGDDMMEEDGSDIDDESNPLAALVASARKAAEQYDRELQNGDEMDDDDESDSDDEDAGVTEVPGGASSRKAFDKVFKQVVEQADVVLYVLDARDPEGTRSRDVERAVIAAAGSGKRLILILNKVDLIPPPILRGWLVHLRSYFPTIPLRASNPAPNAHTFNHRDMTIQSTSATLFRAIKSFAASRNLKRAISVGVIGYPNVGKSSVINALMSRLGGRNQHAACPAGAEAGVTTAIRAVKIDNRLTLLDSPGIVFPSTGSISSFVPKNPTEAHAHLVLLNAVPPKQIEDAVPAVTLLLKRLSASSDLMEKMTSVYDLPPLLTNPESGDATTDFLIQVARKRGRLGRGGAPNINAAAMTVITDWRDGRIQGWNDVPETGAAPKAKATGDDAALPDQKVIVTEWAKEFKLEGLWGDDDAAGATGDVEMAS